MHSFRALLLLSSLVITLSTGCDKKPKASGSNGSSATLNQDNPFPPVEQPSTIKDESLPYVYGRVVIGGELPKPGSVTVHFVNMQEVTNEYGQPRYELRGTQFDSVIATPNKEGIFGVALPEAADYKIYVSVKPSAYKGKSFNPFLGPVESPLKARVPAGPVKCDVLLPLRASGEPPQ